MDGRPIGVFDSGVGGLTVVKEIMKELPKENIIYFGDTLHVPYGSKTPEQVINYCLSIQKFLLEKKCKTIVIACNTASVVSLAALKKASDTKIFDVVTYGIADAVTTTKNKRIGVIATEMTVNSKAYENKLISALDGAKVFQKACPIFTPIVEEGLMNTKVSFHAAKIYLKELKNKNIDTLILGCTHYPLLEKDITKIMTKYLPVGMGLVPVKINIVNPAVLLAKELKKYLIVNNLQNNAEKLHNEFFVSQGTERFDKICHLTLGINETSKLVDIENF